MDGPTQQESFLTRLAGDELLPGPSIALVVAHPDDESIGVGAQLPRMSGLTVVHVTDGAPRRGDAAARQGFDSAEAYAAARRRELEAAMALVGVAPCSLVGFGIADQDATRDMAALAHRLAHLFTKRHIAVVLTHAYEGGHPDHDAVAFAVRWAARLASRLGSVRQPLVVEMPFYHASPIGWVTQAFADVTPPALSLWLGESERALKARLYAAHASQAHVLSLLPIAFERFREAPEHDFAVLPNGGDLLYEREDWGLTGAAWRDRVAVAEAALREDMA